MIQLFHLNVSLIQTQPINPIKLIFVFYFTSRFRTCLKMANSPDANMVGKLFFNVVQTKCFNLKRERVCKKRSLKHFGKCKKYVYKRRAHLMPNRKF